MLVILAAGRAKRYGGALKPLAPVGPQDETIIDLLASDAVAAGFSTLVVVVNPDSGPAIEERVRRAWPAELDVRFATQTRARGTVDAVLSAYDELDGTHAFGVSNGDDLYGPQAMRMLASHLGGAPGDNALVAFRLDHAVVGTSPVTRGLCRSSREGRLLQIDERRGVTRRPDRRFDTGDGQAPAVLDPSALVSMNLWGFASALRDDFEAAMTGADEREVLLPELVGELIARGEGSPRFAVLPTESRCVGVTHPDDLALVRADVAAQIARGERPARPWSDH